MKVNFSKPLIVATVHTRRGLSIAPRMSRTGADILELRLDLLAPHLPLLRKAVEYLQLPVLITARDPREGGSKLIPSARRLELLQSFSAHADLVDVELANASVLLPQIKPVRNLILSYHDFAGTPSTARLRAAWRRAAALGCGCFKAATLTDTPAQLARLIQLLSTQDPPSPIALMGMGRLGRISRLVLPLCGSALTYAFVDRPQVPGQWPAAQLKRELARLAS